MAKKTSKIGSTLDKAAETVGRALGHVAATVEAIPAYRADAAAELDHVMDVAHDVGQDLSSVPSELKGAANTTVEAAKRAATTTVQAAKRVAATTVKAAKHARQSMSSKGRAKARAAARARVAVKPKGKSKPKAKPAKAARKPARKAVMAKRKKGAKKK